MDQTMVLQHLQVLEIPSLCWDLLPLHKLWSNSLTRLLMYGLIVSHRMFPVHLRSYEIKWTCNRYIIVLIYLSQLKKCFQRWPISKEPLPRPFSPSLSGTAWEPDLMTNFDHVDHRLKSSEPCDLKIKKKGLLERSGHMCVYYVK